LVRESASNIKAMAENPHTRPVFTVKPSSSHLQSDRNLTATRLQTIRKSPTIPL